MDRDPACTRYFQPLLFFKGFQALQAHRLAHHLWQNGRKTLAVALQSQISEMFHVDIHPAARVGTGILIDHATGVVIGETAVVGDNVSILHQVTLGGTGSAGGDRHPKIGNGVLIGAGVTILGNISVGNNAKIGAGSVVVLDVPAGTTAVGVPARIVSSAKTQKPVKNEAEVRRRQRSEFPPPARLLGKQMLYPPAAFCGEPTLRRFVPPRRTRAAEPVNGPDVRRRDLANRRDALEAAAAAGQEPHLFFSWRAVGCRVALWAPPQFCEQLPPIDALLDGRRSCDMRSSGALR